MRCLGYVLLVTGAVLGLAAYVFLPPSLVGINGHAIDTHVLAALLSIVLIVFGIMALLIRSLVAGKMTF